MTAKPIGFDGPPTLPMIDGHSLLGSLFAAAGKTDLSAVNVWFAYETTSGTKQTDKATTNELGEFEFLIPSEPLRHARVGAEIEGAQPVDLEPGGETLEPGEVVVVIDDSLGSHLRYA